MKTRKNAGKRGEHTLRRPSDISREEKIEERKKEKGKGKGGKASSTSHTCCASIQAIVAKKKKAGGEKRLEASGSALYMHW
jgi:hypothetical protein